ncbi:MAG: RidA family protein, partial [Candidatus Devosia symbiotica]|nr:RidA family protein [Candidatus Devosia symbiotica]
GASTSPASDATKAGSQVWLVAISEDPASGEIVPGGIAEQMRRTLQNLDIAVRVAGGTLVQYRPGPDFSG